MAGTTTRAKRAQPRIARPKTVEAVTPQDFLDLIAWLDTEVLVERALELRILVLGLVSGTNVHFVGPPGIAKSLGLRAFARRIVGCNYFEKTVNGQTPADALTGGYDMELFATGGGLIRKWTGKAPDAHIVFISELPRANGSTLDALLPLWNTEERLMEGPSGGMDLANTLFACTDSNTWFDADNEQAQALSDRVTLLLEVSEIRSDEAFKDVIRRHHDRNLARFTGQAGPEAHAPSLTLEQVKRAQAEAAAIVPSAAFLDKSAEVRRKALEEGLPCSTRRFMEGVRVGRANAWLAGRDELIPDDLVVFEHILWRDRADRAKAAKIVQEFHGRFVREARDKRAEAAKPLGLVAQIRPQVEGTPPNQDLDPKVIKEAINASRAIDAVKQRVVEVLAEAEKEKRDAHDLRDLDNELLAVQKWFSANNLPTGYRP